LHNFFISGISRYLQAIQNDIGIVARIYSSDELVINTDAWKLKASDFMTKGYAPISLVIDNKRDVPIMMNQRSTSSFIDIQSLQIN